MPSTVFARAQGGGAARSRRHLFRPAGPPASGHQWRRRRVRLRSARLLSNSRKTKAGGALTGEVLAGTRKPIMPLLSRQAGGSIQPLHSCRSVHQRIFDKGLIISMVASERQNRKVKRGGIRWRGYRAISIDGDAISWGSIEKRGRKQPRPKAHPCQSTFIPRRQTDWSQKFWNEME